MLDSAILGPMIRQTLYAVTREESRYSLNGSRWLFGPGMVIVATDGHRLALSESDVPAESCDKIIRSGAQRLIIAILEQAEAPVEMSFNKHNHSCFQIGDYLLSADTVSGNFPDYKRVLDMITGNTAVTLDREVLLAALYRTQPLLDERHRRVDLLFSTGELQISGEAVDFGTTTERIPASIEGDDVRLSFCATYLFDFLESVDSQQVQLKLKDCESPVLLEPISENGERLRAVVMPMRAV